MYPHRQSRGPLCPVMSLNACQLRYTIQVSGVDSDGDGVQYTPLHHADPVKETQTEQHSLNMPYHTVKWKKNIQYRYNNDQFAPLIHFKSTLYPLL